MPHAVFSAQILPSTLEAAPQATHERIPATSDKDRELIAMLRAAARSAVKEWRSRGIEPTQRLLIDMDVYREEVAPLLETHLSAAEADNSRLATAGLSVPAAVTPTTREHAERLCYHAIRTAKGLAVSPTNVHRLIARAMSPGGGEHYDARDLVKFVVGLRAVAETVPEVKALLSRTPESVSSADFAPVVALLRNCAALSTGRVRLRDDGMTLSEVTREHLSGFSPKRVAEVRQALSDISQAAGREDRPLSITDDHSGLLALPSDIAAALAEHDLSYSQWRNLGGWGTVVSQSGQDLVLFEPRLVALRRDGWADSLLEALEPRIIGHHPEYEFSPQAFLAADRGVAVAGMTPSAADAFGAHEEVSRERQRCTALHQQRNRVSTISTIV